MLDMQNRYTKQNARVKADKHTHHLLKSVWERVYKTFRQQNDGKKRARSVKPYSYHRALARYIEVF